MHYDLFRESYNDGYWSLWKGGGADLKHSEKWHCLVQQPAFQVYGKSNCNQSN